jgi:hypothetical protein
MTLTREQIERALDHLRSDYPEPMTAEDRESYYLVLRHFRQGELLRALEKLPPETRPDPDLLLRVVMEARPAPFPGPRTRGGRPGRASPEFVYGVIEQAREDLNRVRDAV